ncbi:hypothetical protein EXIGLDRAFT_837841 [Exidia glandulosa HHB12029]|uniref:RCC1/BLIP-II protein n=1 Tax=Exidia glandulosa HHB12029 TaxID=1314781 RepID=A0A165GFH9_EXIGL|nr:hypothetical protein EXIGLDRAFT_837841 [Exidia glandulosa HHB12029]
MSASLVRGAARRAQPVALALAAGSAVSVTVWSLQTRKYANDDAGASKPAPPVVVAVPTNWDASTLVWGSNKSKLISPEASAADSFRSPAALDLQLPPVRDLALAATHGALVDARGDVYQWGDGHFGTRSVDNREPMATLKGKRLEPMGVHALSVSPAPSGHVLLTLDTISRFGTGGDAPARRDLLVWGMNQSSQLGNGARKSLATPQHLEDAAGNRAMLGEKWTRVLDLQGNVWGRNVKVEQRVVAGHDCSIAYWKIVE